MTPAEREISKRRAAEIAADAPAPSAALKADLSLLLKPAVEQLARERLEVKTKARKRAAPLRQRDRLEGPPEYHEMPNGDQVIEVAGYTYRWPAGESTLSVGDQVVVPANEIFPARIGKVTRLGSSWRGSPATILRRADKNDLASLGAF